jgi:hypothetical protein
LAAEIEPSLCTPRHEPELVASLIAEIKPVNGQPACAKASIMTLPIPPLSPQIRLASEIIELSARKRAGQDDPDFDYLFGNFLQLRCFD